MGGQIFLSDSNSTVVIREKKSASGLRTWNIFMHKQFVQNLGWTILFCLRLT